MKKGIIFTSIIFFVFLLITACDQPGKPPMSEQDAALMTARAMTGVDTTSQTAVQDESGTDMVINYNGAGFVVTGTGTNTASLLSGDVTVVFMNYVVPATTTVLNGTVSMQFSMDLNTDDISFSYSGNLDILYEGTTYECSWEFEFSGNTNTMIFTADGYYKINGYSYTFNYP